MKTKLLLLFNLFLCTALFSNEREELNGNSSAIQDYNLRQLIINTYPGVDRNNDGDISINEANGTAGSIPSTLTLNFNYFTFANSGVDFRGIEHFEVSKFRFIGSTYQGNYLKIYNLDLSKLGGVLNTNVTRFIDEFYISGLEFTSLNFKNARRIIKMYFVNCGSGSNLEEINTMPHNNILTDLEINNTSLFATLNIGTQTNLKNFFFRNTYIEGLNVENCPVLERLFVEGVGELSSVTLPTVASNLKHLTINGMPKLGSLDITKYTNLESLVLQTGSGFPNNIITTLDFQNKIKLEILKLENLKSISSVSMLQNTAITELLLVGINPSIALLDLSNQTQLKKLTLSANKIPVLDLSNNTALETFDGYGSEFTSVNLGTNSNLKELYLSSNKLTSFDAKNLTGLERLELDDNLLISIDITQNINLEWLRCQRNNNLKIANVANGNNANMNEWDFKAVFLDQNPNLTCILVDDNVINSIPVQWQKDVTASYGMNNEISYTDANFKNELLNYSEVIDLDGNGKIASCEAEQVIGALNLPGKSIQNLSGIGAFKNLTGLNVNNNNLGALDVTANTKLLYLYASNSGLNSINFQNLGELDDLIISKNNLNSISFTGNLKLTKVDVSDNKLTGLPISQLNKLYLLDCSNNELASLVVTSNPNLEILYASNNKFVSLAAVPNMIDLSNNQKLKQLNVKDNDLTLLDVGANPEIIEVICTNNQLEALNLANLNNNLITNVDATGNMNLACIQIDNNFTPPSSWLKDSNTTFSANCATASVDDKLIQDQIRLYPNPFKDKIFIQNTSSKSIQKIEIYNNIGKRVLTSRSKSLQSIQLAKGIYFIKIFIDDTAINKKLIKQ